MFVEAVCAVWDRFVEAVCAVWDRLDDLDAEAAPDEKLPLDAAPLREKPPPPPPE
ncbi:hypothetical protein [Methylomagnum sp.]